MTRESQPSRRVIEDLHQKAGVTKINLRLAKERVEEEITTGGQSEAHGRAHEKAEKMALLAILIEDVWETIANSLKDQPENLSSYTDFLDEEEIQENLLGFQNDPQKILGFLHNASYQTIVRAFDEWHRKMWDIYTKTQAGIINPTGLREIAYSRYMNLSFGGENSDRRVLHGFNTAFFNCWGVLGILPNVYREQFGREMPPEEFDRLAQNSLQLIYALAGSHIDVFIGLEDNIHKKPTKITYDTENLIPEPSKFYFRSDKSGNLYLELKEGVLQSSSPKNRSGEAGLTGPQTGCPAIFSKGVDQRNVIAELFEWLRCLAKKYYVPNLK